MYDLKIKNRETDRDVEMEIEDLEYPKELLKVLSKELTKQYGKGFSRSNLQSMRKFYLEYKKCQTLSGKLSWSHYLLLLGYPIRTLARFMNMNAKIQSGV